MIGQPKAGFVPGHVGSLGLGYSRDSLRSYVKAGVNEMDGVADGPRERGEVASTGDEQHFLSGVVAPRATVTAFVRRGATDSVRRSMRG